MVEPAIDVAARDRAILTAAAHAVVVVGEHGVVAFATPAALRVLPVATVGSWLMDAVDAEHHRLLDAALARADEEAVEFRAVDGRWAEAIVSDLRDEPDVRGHVLSVRDVTEQRRLGDQVTKAYLVEREAAARARALDDVKAGLLAAVSHDFRTPLTSIVGFGDLLRRHWSRFSEDDRVEMLGRMVGAAEELGRRVDDFLDLSRREAGPLDVCLEPLHVGDLVQAAVDRLELVLDEHDVIVEPGPDVEVLGDRAASTRILENLLGNAAKYAPEGSAITVTVEVDPAAGCASIGVTDEGPGIDPDDHVRIFDRFVRATAGTAPAPRGAGVGLAAARDLAEAQDGRVEVCSRLGAGATFRFVLPLVTPEVPA
jgi:signal transduction histidine kinase